MRRVISFSIAVLAMAPSLYAHGPQMQVTADAGKIVTREILLDGPYAALTSPKKVYVMPFVDDDRSGTLVTYARPNYWDPEFYSGAGLAYGYRYDAAANPQPFPVGSKFGIALTDGFRKWNGAAFSDPGVAQIQAFTGGFAAPTGAAVTTDGGPFGSLAVPAGAGTVDFSQDGGETHSTARFRYLGDGSTPSSAPDGIYLLKMQVTNNSSSPALTPSDPFHYVLNKHGDPSELAEAIASLGAGRGQVQVLVPEPASASLAVVGMAAAAIVARCRKLKRS